jgi:hypothetical protein
MHSSESERLGGDQKTYFNWLASLRNDYSEIYVSIHYCDRGGIMESCAKKSGLSVVYGARPDDENALLRMRSIYDYFDYVTSNVLCSAILYAGFSGCRISISGPTQYTIEDSIFNNIALAFNPIDPMFVKRLKHTSTRTYAEQNYPEFCHESPKGSSRQVNLCRDLIGWDNQLTDHEIYDALRWGLFEQVGWSTRGVLRRTARLLMKSKQGRE